MTAVDVKMAQCNCFKLLSACFYEPEKELFTQENLCGNLTSLFAQAGCQAAAEAAARMGTALMQDSSEDLCVEHARLFVGPFELVAPPYGSVHLEKARRVMGDSTMEVQRMYQEAGLALDVKEAPDHIALELEFMHYLSLLEANAAGEDTARVHEVAQKQAEFFHHFLSPWVPDFCQAIRKGTDNAFYMALADCLESFVDAMTAGYALAGICKPKEADCACRAAV